MAKKKKATGKLIAVDMYNCDLAVIEDAAKAEELLLEGCKKFNMQCEQILSLKETEHKEYSLSAVCKQGHVTLHIYPDLGFIAADVFTCFSEADSAGMARYLRVKFSADKSKITLLDRGDFGSESDMKPKRRASVKFIRRTKNLGGRLKKIILKPRPI